MSQAIVSWPNSQQGLLEFIYLCFQEGKTQLRGRSGNLSHTVDNNHKLWFQSSALEAYRWYIIKQIKLRWEWEFCILSRLFTCQNRYLSTEQVQYSPDRVSVWGCKAGRKRSGRTEKSFCCSYITSSHARLLFILHTFPEWLLNSKYQVRRRIWGLFQFLLLQYLKSNI